MFHSSFISYVTHFGSSPYILLLLSLPVTLKFKWQLPLRLYHPITGALLPSQEPMSYQPTFYSPKSAASVPCYLSEANTNYLPPSKTVAKAVIWQQMCAHVALRRLCKGNNHISPAYHASATRYAIPSTFIIILIWSHNCRIPLSLHLYWLSPIRPAEFSSQGV